MSKADLARKSQFSATTISNVESDESIIGIRNARRLADALNLPIDEVLAAITESKLALGVDDEANLRQRISELGLHDAALVRGVSPEPAGTRRLPIVGDVSAGGTNIAVDDGGYPHGTGFDYVSVPISIVDDEHAFAVRVVGDSMAPVYREGEKLVISPRRTVFPGDDAIVRTAQGKVYLKRVTFKDDSCILHSYNSTVEEKIVPRKDVIWMYKVIARFL